MKTNKQEKINQGLSQWIVDLRSEIELAEKLSSQNNYSQAHNHFHSAFKIADRNGLAKIAEECATMAGNAAYALGSWLDYQQASRYYASVGNVKMLEGMFKELKYTQEDITPGTWMGMSRYLANANHRRYNYD